MEIPQNTGIGLISASAVFVSSVTLYLTQFRVGRLIFDEPNFMAAHKYDTHPTYGSQDILIVPVSVTNTGVGPRSLRLKLIVNEQYAFHHSVNFDKLPVAAKDEGFSPKGLMSVPMPLVFNGRTAVQVIAGFTQANVLPKQNSPLRCDLWYHDVKKWRKVFRIDWAQFDPTQYGPGLILSTRGFTVTREFTYSYNRDLVDK